LRGDNACGMTSQHWNRCVAAYRPSRNRGMTNIYTTDEYLKATKLTWHSEDSPWKASQILQMITKNELRPRTVAEIGCGAGRILYELSKNPYFSETTFDGYDISPHAITLCREIETQNLRFHCADLLDTAGVDHLFDVLLVIDVYEHIPDYIGFVAACRRKAKYKIYHIPLDISVSSVVRNSFIRSGGVFPGGRHHLHYFTADWALATLAESGHEIVESRYTCGSFGVFWKHPTIRTAIANGPRWLLDRFSVALSARILGGYSLLVLAK